MARVQEATRQRSGGLLISAVAEIRGGDPRRLSSSLKHGPETTPVSRRVNGRGLWSSQTWLAFNNAVS